MTNAAAGRPLKRSVVLLLALTSGASVANLYYVQPLLHRVAGALHVGDGAAGLLVTATQVGYVVGLALLVPVGDLVERRRLIGSLLALSVVAAAVCAAAGSFAVLVIGLVALGVLSVVAQIVVALASSLAAEEQRGQVVGTVMSGLLIGILLARTFSGLVAQAAGWRVVFIAGSAVMLALLALIIRALPSAPATDRIRYPVALRSVLVLVRREPVLRLRMVLAAIGFGTFSVLWTSLAFLLSGRPFGYGEAVIGLFGLAGAAGAGAAPFAGRMADRGHSSRVQITLYVLLVASWGLLLAGRREVVPLIAGIVLLDFAIQGAHVSNQHAVYALDAMARSRLTTAYMVASFTGGIIGSTLSAVVWSGGGWRAVCALGGGLSVLAVVVWLAAAPRVAARAAAATESSV